MSRRLCLALVLLLTLAAPLAAAEVTSSASVAGNTGRLVVAWGEAVSIATGRAGDAVEIRAERPFPADITEVARSLAPLLDALVLDDDARTLRLEPADGVIAEATIIGDRSLMVELRQGRPRPLGLRIGQHADFTRAVIEPLGRGEAGVAHGADSLTLTLPGRLSQDDRDRLSTIPGVAGVDGVERRLILALTPGTTVRELFVAPDRQVLDFRTPTEAPAPTNPPSVTAGQAAGPAPPLAPFRPRARPSALASEDAVPRGASPVADDQGPSGAAGSTIAPSWSAPLLARLAIVAARHADDAVELRFDWPEAVPAAVFVRGAQLWVAFAARSEAIDIRSGNFVEIAGRHVGTMRQEPHPEATLFRLALHGLQTSRSGARRAVWRLTLRDARPKRRRGPPSRFRVPRPAASCCRG
jgi:hypothetical protein